MARGGAWVAVCAAAMLSATHADAQESDAPSSDDEARVLFEAGVYAFTGGRFEEALEHFQRSHSLSGRPQLLYNIGITADRLQREELALESFERYLEELPDADNRAEVEGRIEALRRALAPEPETSGPANEPVDDDGGRLWTWVAGGAAIAFAAGASILWWRADSTYDDLAAECRPNRCSQDRIDDSGGPTLQLFGNIAIGVAAAAAVAGVVLFFVESGSGEAETEVAIGPASVHVAGRF